MNLKSLQKIKASFVTREVGNELVLVPLAGNVAQMNELFTMNETGKFIWENINNETTMDELAEKMVEVFEVSPEIAKRDVVRFLERMSEMLS
jgi:Coenzyme PQQ synthesis protein D (PqqD)